MQWTAGIPGTGCIFSVAGAAHGTSGSGWSVRRLSQACRNPGARQSVNRLTLYADAITVSNTAGSGPSRRSSVKTCCSTSKDGSRSRVSAMTTPRAPSEVTAPPNRRSSRPRATTDPSAVISSTSRTDVASGPLPTPEPCVPVATEPATEMCGREAMLASARPCACTVRASSAYRTPPETRTVRASRSTSITGGSPAIDSRTPSGPGSAISLKECPLPSTRTLAPAATRALTAPAE